MDWLNDAVKGFLPGPNPDAGLDLVEQAYPGRPIPPKVAFLLTEIVDSMRPGPNDS